MNLVVFPARTDLAQGWDSAELQKLVTACGCALASGDASGWETGSTEAGDPQLYLLGPAPDYDCILCISRLGRHYVVEDGQGHVLHEHGSLTLLGEHVWALLSRKKAAITARIAVAWCAVRETFEEKVEPLLEGPGEFLTHMAPQLAALA